MRPSRLRYELILFGLVLCPVAAFGQVPVFDTPEKLWRDFNPESPDLEIESLKKWEEQGAAFEKLRFTSEREAGGKVRVFAIRGAPREGTRLPGILHIHGGGQTASLEWVRFWAKRGYVCVTFDYSGPWAGRKEFTDWGPIKQGNLTDAQGGLMFRPTARSSSFFHWALAARRALTLLSYHPKVDRDRLGIFGISVGGTLSWIVAATDERVKTSVPIYGCGYNYDRRKTVWGFPDLNPDLLLFNRVLAPEAYASSIRKPVLFLGATNDFHGWMDNAYQILSETHVTRRLALTPRYNHHIDNAPAANLPAWMDWQLRGGPPFPAEPKLELTIAPDTDPSATVLPDDARHVDRVDIFYALGEKPPPNRFWRHAQTTRTAIGWKARLPLLKSNDKCRAFANVHYRSGVCLSTNMGQRLSAGSPQNEPRATLKWTASPNVAGDELGAPFVFARASTDPIVPISYFVRSDDRADPDVICLNPALFGSLIRFGIVTHYIGDPGYVSRDGMSLAFDYQGDFIQDKSPQPSAAGKNNEADPGGLTVEVTAHDWTPLARRYTAHVDTQIPAADWHTATLPVSQFHTDDGKPLPSWRELDKLEIRGTTTKQNPPRFRRFHWLAQ
ncbi:MAG TPA: acetylxylan esterase [Planctomycetaceae bacterium]|nr:acetylxylan esterase [Planctomycetaceae bacterium]